MSQTTVNTDQEWLKVLGKGMITIPKKWREEMGIAEGDIVKAKKEGNKVVIATQKSNLAPYRIYNNKEIDEFLNEDELPKSLLKNVSKDLSSS